MKVNKGKSLFAGLEQIVAAEAEKEAEKTVVNEPEKNPEAGAEAEKKVPLKNEGSKPETASKKVPEITDTVEHDQPEKTSFETKLDPVTPENKEKKSTEEKPGTEQRKTPVSGNANKKTEKTGKSKQQENGPEETPILEQKIKTSVRLYAEADVFVKVRSSQLRMSQSSYLELLVKEEREREEAGERPDPFRIQSEIPPKLKGSMKYCEWSADIYEFVDEESHYLGLKKAEYMNYLVHREIERENRDGQRRL